MAPNSFIWYFNTNNSKTRSLSHTFYTFIIYRSLNFIIIVINANITKRTGKAEEDPEEPNFSLFSKSCWLSLEPTFLFLFSKSCWLSLEPNFLFSKSCWLSLEPTFLFLFSKSCWLSLEPTFLFLFSKSCWLSLEPVSYTHLTLPTIYSV